MMSEEREDVKFGGEAVRHKRNEKYRRKEVDQVEKTVGNAF